MQPSVLQFGFQTGQVVLERNLADVTEEESRRAPQPLGNCINWMVGHLLWTRTQILDKGLGTKTDTMGLDLAPYGIGSGPLPAGSAGAPLARLMDALRTSNAAVAEKLGGLTAAELEREIDPKMFPFPPEHPTFGNLLM